MNGNLCPLLVALEGARNLGFVSRFPRSKPEANPEELAALEDEAENRWWPEGVDGTDGVKR